MAEYLSEHFTLDEMIYSDTAARKGINNAPTETHKKTLKHTCEYFLEPLRALLNQHYSCKVYIHINSGYRSAKLNAAIPGSSKTSQHMTGEAVDMSVFKVVNGLKVKIDSLEVHNLIKKWVKEGKISVDQLIYEVSGGAIWNHASYSAWGATKNRKQYLRFTGGKYIND